MKSIFTLIFPNRCIGCHRILPQNQSILCVRCLDTLAYTHWFSATENDLWNEINQNGLFSSAYSLFYYDKGLLVQKLLHANKYYNQPKVGSFIAKLIPETYLVSVNADVVTFVPSHAKTLRSRGYNQVKNFASSVAKCLNISLIPDLLERKSRKDSQTKHNRTKRFSQLENAFVFNTKYDFSAPFHVLLIDDLATTGSTLIHCAEVLKEAIPAVEISVLTMAFARS